jgi:hypothetical protein
MICVEAVLALSWQNPPAPKKNAVRNVQRFFWEKENLINPPYFEGEKKTEKSPYITSFNMSPARSIHTGTSPLFCFNKKGWNCHF